MTLRRGLLAFSAGAALGVVLALVAGALLVRIDDALLWLIPISGAVGLVGLITLDLVTRGQRNG